MRTIDSDDESPRPKLLFFSVHCSQVYQLLCILFGCCSQIIVYEWNDNNNSSECPCHYDKGGICMIIFSLSLRPKNMVMFPWNHETWNQPECSSL